MKNKDFQLSIILSIMTTIIFSISILTINCKVLRDYEYNNNLIISNLISNVKEEYPDFDDTTLINMLNDKNLKDNKTLRKYGIDITKESVSIANKKMLKESLIINIAILSFYLLSIIIIIFVFNFKENKKIKQITNYIKEINNKNYQLDIMSNSEDELSILKNEIYKTAVTLNEQAILLTKDKNTLKDSLSDISHQLKTPLTSINLMIDTLRDSNISEQKKHEILINIHRKISNINFLVQSLLKLSKFDANTIVFKDELNKVDDILNEVADNLSTLIDLKNIKINIKGNKKDKLYCDFKWQVEAITNVVKNCIEHSNESSNIDISYSSNDLFTKIIIKDYGKGMSHEDEKHIFERFYKGENSSSDSVGIGLALAQSIIEKDKGYIIVSSELSKGTTFTIKYIK